MASLKQQVHSKTVVFNVVTFIVAIITRYTDLEIPADVSLGIVAIGNYILRLITKGPVNAK